MSHRGEYMGITAPYGGIKPIDNDYIDIASSLAVLNLRCGYPEVVQMCSTPSGASLGTFDVTLLEEQVAAAATAGMGFCFSFLNLPNECTGAGSGKRWPTNSTQRSVTANLAAQCATALMNSKRSTGYDVWFEPLQEPNIPSFNVDSQSAATWASACKAIIDAVRSAEPSCPIIIGSIANRGDINNASDADVIAHWDGPNFLIDALAGEPTLKTTSAPDYWGWHPYCGTADPLSLTTGWGMQQLYAARAILAVAGAQAPDGSRAKLAVTEYGSIRTRDITGTWTTDTSSLTVSVASGGSFTAGTGSPYDWTVLGEVGAVLSGTGLASNTKITAVNSSNSVTVDKYPTSTATSSRTFTVTRNEWQAEHMRRYLTQFVSFRDAGWLSGPEFTMEEVGTSKSLVDTS